MSDQIEELIKEVAAKHGIAIARDDPILVLETINSRLLHQSAQAQQVRLDHFKEELEALSMRWRTDAKSKADRILNAALSAGHELLRTTIRDSADTTAERVRAEIDNVLSDLERVEIRMKRTAFLNLLASCITMLTVAVVAFTWIR